MTPDDFERIMEVICDLCHWPHVCDQETLDTKCENCPAEAALSIFSNK